MNKRLKPEYLSIDDLELDAEFVPRLFKKNKIKNKTRKLSKKQWLLLQHEEENLKIEEIEQNGCDFTKQ